MHSNHSIVDFQIDPLSFDVAVFGDDEPWVSILGCSGRSTFGRVWQRAAPSRRVVGRDGRTMQGLQRGGYGLLPGGDVHGGPA